MEPRMKVFNVEEYGTVSELASEAGEYLLEEKQLVIEGDGELEKYARKVWNEVNRELSGDEIAIYSEIEEGYYMWLEPVETGFSLRSLLATES